jgi:O-antigen ligase
MQIKRILNYIAVFIIFASGLSFFTLGGGIAVRGLFVLVLLVFFLWLPFLKDIYLHKTFALVFFIIVISSIYNISAGNDTTLFFLKQAAGILCSSVFFYLLFKINKCDVKSLFEIYLNIAFIVAVIGLVQELSFLAAFKPGYDFSYILPGARSFGDAQNGFLRVSSILIEPSQFCSTMMPAFFVSVVSLFSRQVLFTGLNRWKSALIITAFLLTFSTIGYVGIFFTIALLAINYRKMRYVILSGVAAFVLFFFFYSTIPLFTVRVVDSAHVLTGRRDLERSNQSVYALGSNVLVTWEVFRRSPFFGAGLGSHPVSHDRHISKVVDLSRVYYEKVNAQDAGSFLLRLLSETGLFGLLAFLIFIMKCYVPKGKDNIGYFWMISNAVLVLFLIKLIRNGHYFNGGFFFFFWLYYFTRKAVSQQEEKCSSWCLPKHRGDSE